MTAQMEKRACELAVYIIETEATVRMAAQHFGVSKSTVHKDIAFRLRQLNPALYHAARAVLAQRPSCRVIFVTAYSLFQYAHEAVHLGACDYLLKPVDPDELEASVRRAMRQIETERKLEELAMAEAGREGL